MTRILIMYSTERPTDGHVRRLAALPGVASVTAARSEAEAVAAGREAEVYLGHRYLRQCLAVATNVRWVQSTAGGVDHLDTDVFRRRAPLLTRCPIFADVIAQHAFALMFALMRSLPAAIEAARAGMWGRPIRTLALPRTAMVIGQGCIGGKVNNLLRAAGIETIGVVPEGREIEDATCDHLVTTANWRQSLPRCDAVFITIPGKPANVRFFDAAAMDALPGHAMVINVGRGSVIDTPALLARLEQGKLGGAGLDVLDNPPAAGDPLWSTPNLIVTPKVASFTPGRQQRLESFIEDQVRCFLAGQTPRFVVESSRFAMIGES